MPFAHYILTIKNIDQYELRESVGEVDADMIDVEIRDISLSEFGVEGHLRLNDVARDFKFKFVYSNLLQIERLVNIAAHCAVVNVKVEF